MVRNYKRKTNQKPWSKSQLIEAVNEVVGNGMTIKQAMQEYNIPKSTLERWCRKAKCDGIKPYTQLQRLRTVFTEEQEHNLKQHIKDMHFSLHELSSLELRQIAFQFAEMNNIPHKFNKERRLAGYDWYTNFMKRNSDMKPKLSDNSLFNGISNVYNIDKFFDLLMEWQQFHKFPSNRIYNVNDSCSILLPNLKSRILGTRDKTSLHNDLVSIITCCNAAGSYVPPLMIFPSEEENPQYSNGCPPGSIIVCHPSGSIQNEIFFPTWFEHFVNYTKPSKIDPILLLLNGRALHVRNLEFIEKAKQSNIHILSVPVNSKYMLNPLELNFMETLKKNYFEKYEKWMKENEGRFINLKNVGELFGTVYMEAATTSNAVDGFRISGIYPLNRDAFTDNDQAQNSLPVKKENNQYRSKNKITNNDVTCKLNSQSKNCRLVIKGPSDINHAAADNQEFSVSLFNDFIKDENTDSNSSFISEPESKVAINEFFFEDTFELHD